MNNQINMNDSINGTNQLPCSDCDALKKECAEYKTGWQRAVADYQNLQKEVSRQRADWATMSELAILQEFLPIYANFKMAFAAPHGDDQWTRGIGFIMKQFSDALKAHDIEEIKTVGEVFDAARHEAVGEEASDQPEHTIVREVETGYVMKGKVIKVAKVIVSKTKDPD